MDRRRPVRAVAFAGGVTVLVALTIPAYPGPQATPTLATRRQNLAHGPSSCYTRATFGSPGPT